MNEQISPSKSKKYKEPEIHESNHNSYIVLNYLDEKENVIKKADVIYGKVSEKIKLTFPKFDNYILSKISDFNLRFTEQTQKINITYIKKMGQPIICYYFDYDNYRMIKKPDFKYGFIESNYYVKPPKIHNYKIYLTSGNQNGIISNSVQTINYYYRLENWQLVQKVNYFLQLKNNVIPFTSPEGNQLNDQLPENSIWKAFIAVKTKKETWFNLGGNQWIKASECKIVSNNSNIYLPNKMPKIINQSKINQPGIVNFIPNKTIPVFDRPYGAKVKNLNHNEIITVDEIIEDENKLNWYHIYNQGYVIQNYINLTAKED